MSGKPQQELVDAVRNWVHFDNLAESLTKQVNNARTMRNNYEEKVMNLLEASGMPNAVLQINGATLQRKTRVKQSDLSWTYLEEQLHSYFEHAPRDDTAAILIHLQQRRTSETISYLKKSVPADTAKGKNPSV